MAATPEGENSNNQHLPQDVIVEILLRLPVKSLLRFRLVSKSWMSQIDNPVFIKLHLDLSLVNSSTSSSFIVDCYKKDTEEKLISLENCVNLNYNITKSRSRIVGSCNGLVCLLNYHPNIVIWNPATNQARPLPKPIIIVEPNLVKVGFGFDAVANDYKVVRIAFQNYKYSHARVEVYSVNNGSWREIKIEFPFCRLFGDTCSAIVRGDPYFLVATALEEVWSVASFDMHNEIIRHALSLPEVCKNYRSSWDLTSFKDLLVVVIHSSNLEEGFSFWAMDVNDSGVNASWTLISQVVPFPEKTYRMGYLKNGEIVARNAKGEVFMYDPKTKEIKDVRIPVDTRMDCVYNYIGTLVPIRGSKQVPTNPKRRKRYFWGK